MNSTPIMTALVVTALMLPATSAQAQMQWTDKGFVNVNFGAQAPSRTLGTDTRFDIYGEEASFRTTQDVAGGAFFDLAGGYKVWRNLVAGIGYTRVSSEADLSVNGDIPDPIFFDRHRPVTTTFPGAKHTQQSIHLMGTWMMPVTDKVDVGFEFGPTIFLVSQDVPGSVEVSEPGPTITSSRLVKVDKTTVGIHLGVDATYLVTPKYGVGVLVRYTVGSADIEGASDGLGLGGFQIGFGGRYRF